MEEPARLIDLEVFGTESTHARLVRIVGPGIKYATLSYCWGSKMPSESTTTLANIASRQERIDPSELPQTIRDVFMVTRKLGVRYLWVDALCIIQDCRTDWEKESAKMASIYGHGLVSIAAETRPSCTDGFLTYTPEEDNPCIDHMFPIRGKLIDGQDSSLYVWVRGHCACFIRDTIKSLQNTELSKRGWTYQERFLAPRILHFVGAQVLWGCRKLHGLPLENGRALRDMDNLHDIRPRFAPIANLLFDPQSDVTESHLRKLWYSEVVPEFSRRTLSKKRDKLPAISGIAKAFQSRLKNTYLAGVWLEDISCALSWHPKYAAERPGSYRAPTFSWASIDGPINWQLAPQKFESSVTPYIHLEDHHLEFTGRDCFGCVSGGWIRLSGFVGYGIIRDHFLICEKSDVAIGHSYFDFERTMGKTEGWKVRYLPLFRTPSWSVLLLLRQRSHAALEFERVGFADSIDMDIKFLDEAWLSQHCLRTAFNLF